MSLEPNSILHKPNNDSRHSSLSEDQLLTEQIERTSLGDLQEQEERTVHEELLNGDLEQKVAVARGAVAEEERQEQEKKEQEVRNLREKIERKLKEIEEGEKREQNEQQVQWQSIEAVVNNDTYLGKLDGAFTKFYESHKGDKKYAQILQQYDQLVARIRQAISMLRRDFGLMKDDEKKFGSLSVLLVQLDLICDLENQTLMIDEGAPILFTEDALREETLPETKKSIFQRTKSSIEGLVRGKDIEDIKEKIIKRRKEMGELKKFIKVWKEFYSKIVGQSVDLSSLEIEPRPGYWPIIVVPNMSEDLIVNSLCKLFDVKVGSTEDSDARYYENFIIEKEQVVANRPYIVWFPSDITRLENKETPSITLRERLLLEGFYFLSYKKHLEDHVCNIYPQVGRATRRKGVSSRLSNSNWPGGQLLPSLVIVNIKIRAWWSGSCFHIIHDRHYDT